MTSTTTMAEFYGNAQVRDYIALLKPKVMSLVVFSGFAGLWVAPNVTTIHPVILATAILCLAINAGAAGAINMWFERDIDGLMNRTKMRPLPQHKIHPDDALAFGLVLTLFSVMLMGIAVNWMAAGILAFANFFYSVIYTMILKRSTPQNIVIGGAAGAFPPMIGWAAVTGDITLASISLFMIIFLWTPPHFWALALFTNDDYKRANVPMMPLTHGERHTKIQMLIYTIILAPVAVSPYFLGVSGMFYGIGSAFLSLFFIFTAIKTLTDDTHKSAKQMFGYSVFYLFAIFLLLMLDKV